MPAIDLKTGVVHSPFVVVLGAGASAAVCPTGDRNGKQLPVMNNFESIVKIEDIVARSGYRSSGTRNFEDFYDWLSRGNDTLGLINELEERVYDYFANIQIPQEATPYDYLILGLRSKDVIATFNWDPLLVQAFRRNASMRELPQMLFLHGNVAVGVCPNSHCKGFVGDTCASCGHPLRATKLLYPISRKDYTSDVFIRNEWQLFSEYISEAYLLMIYGYSAPRTDVEAKSIMHKAWGANQTRELAEIEIVDIKPAPQIRQVWDEFIVRHHFAAIDRVEHSWLCRHPRRTCEAFAAATLQNQPLRNEPMPLTKSVEELQRSVTPLITEEVAYTQTGTPFSSVVPLGPRSS